MAEDNRLRMLILDDERVIVDSLCVILNLSRFKARGVDTHDAAIPSPHNGNGELHVAFAIPAVEPARWEAWLEENGIAIEEKRTWDLGGQSMYFRDPDRHLLEVASPGVWSIY